MSRTGIRHSVIHMSSSIHQQGFNFLPKAELSDSLGAVSGVALAFRVAAPGDAGAMNSAVNVRVFGVSADGIRLA